MQASNQQEWSEEYKCWVLKYWSSEHNQYYYQHYVNGKWEFLQWVRIDTPTQQATQQATQQTTLPVTPAAVRIQGPTIAGTYSTLDTRTHEPLDSSYFVRPKSFFIPGRLFAVLFTQGAGANITNYYNDSITEVAYPGEYAHTQIRRFVVVRQRKAHCYAIPISTYSNRATTKPGLNPDEHAIAFSYGRQPVLISGERPLVKDPICFIMNQNEPPLSIASRIYFSIHHPIQYNVKVKDFGYVHPDCLETLLGYWAQEEVEE